MQVSAGILFSSPCLFSWMFIWAAISYQLQEYIHRIWMHMVHLSRYNDCLKFGNSWGGSFCSSQFTFFNVKCSRNLVNLGNPFLSSILIQNLPKTPKNVQSAGFHTCFRYGNIVIPTVFALALFMHSKILPQIFLPKYSRPYIFSVHTRRVEIGHILSIRSLLYMYIYTCVCIRMCSM